MHLPIPHITKKSEKRKASLDSSLGDDEIARVERTKSKSKSKKKQKTTTNHDTMKSTRQTSPSPSPSRSPSLWKDSTQDSPTTTTHPSTTDAHTQTQTHTTPNPETPAPRRSERIKNSMHVVAETWTKCRPYIERINGTIMPLEPQGTKAYYARDGVRVD